MREFAADPPVEERVGEALRAAGDTVAVRGRYVGHQDGAGVAFGWADIHRFAHGVVVERHTYTDRDSV